MEETTNNSNSNGENNRWAWIVTGIVVLVAIIGFYSWPQKAPSENAQAPANNVEEDTYTASLNNVSPSDEVADIEKDLNDTNVTDLDKEATDVDATINAQ